MAIGVGVRFKADDIWETPDDGLRYEVIDGELYVSPAPALIHQYASGQMHAYVGHYLQQHPIGSFFAAPVGLVLDAESGLQPDFVYVSNERRAILTERGIEGVPDLVVEIHSPGTRSRDRGVKLRRYARAGVPHYWMLNPPTQELEAYKLGPDGYELIGTFGPGATFCPELFPGLEIPIDALWRLT